ncbi:hypothetical protein CRG98_020837 [Punica granatum]|uniref:RNase H type-1 domain-containing protein n=1 Tax=Punica granatum TaxID=22663 RepID=A0A2I0JR61_PUNGR|nr:hypothetical protein CRG98_020837 [Punica granatum]
MKPPMDEDGEDIMFWKLESSGCFLVSSPYRLIAAASWADVDTLWKLWKGPQRIQTNLRRYRTDPDGRWASIFAIGCWMLWGWRNKELFEADFMRPSNMAAPVLQFSSTSRQAISSANKFAKSSREWRWISWNKPLHEWLKLNTDGASKGNPRLAGAGGVLRDCNGRWVDGLAHNIGVSSAMVAELWGAPHRLEICLGSRA